MNTIDKITNISGQIIKKSRINDKQFDIELGKQPKGIYLVKILTDKGMMFRKVILE
ncbi:MAG: T9SS type A sorting domain-containing protein [Bacteroidetes bacterium]|nr:T9SS type A sorting domain-containing protein [Bacteroidota bacterium]MBT3750649.1 T9SS type A sorting domain-containing protein [Bacteroidota bacterium]MBT4398134.1 T9SS type A sorting domain-containing protein [Bacteroidota bacterium]MBT7463981.1 T9SS type A sorting domain-containing protein [Bacteroidota bacterium]